MKSSLALPTSWNVLASISIRVLVWGLFFVVLYLLRSFFLLVFLTFVFAYVQNSGVKALQPKISSRPLRVTLIGLIFLSILIILGLFLVPRVREQTELFTQHFGELVADLDRGLLRLTETYPVLAEMAPWIKSDPNAHAHVSDSALANSASGKLLMKAFGLGEAEQGTQNLKVALNSLRDFGAKLLGVGSAFLLSLLFSFLIVLDLPKLSAGVRDLSRTKVAFIYNEVAGSLHRFGSVLGNALQAQLLIALMNTILTAAGIWFLGVSHKLAFLSVLVFLCSFIPVAGVFISSIPICLLAFQQGGLLLASSGALLIWIIHLIEAYILNPKIYGHHLRLNPVVVLIILTLGGKLFGIWGLVLGLPVCTYIYRYAIR